jgi:acetylornithine deacetylase/succinyl-diaminopimelate desuccinylase-like protein
MSIQPMFDALETQLIERISATRDAMVAFCAHLLQTPSVNGVHDEIDVAEALVAEARALGLEARLEAEDPRRPNVIISTSASGETGLLLLGHLDTVPPGEDAAWTHPPYSGLVADGRIHGRGAIDTKGGMTAALYALAALARTPGALYGGRAQLICVPNEESGATGELGINHLTRQGLLAAKGAIYAYSGHEIALGHRGVLRYRLTCRGESEHTGSEAWQNGTRGVNAVTGMARLLLALEQVDLPYSRARYFEAFKTMVTPGTVIRGGTNVNVVPDYCEALLDARLTPEYDRERFEALLDSVIAGVAAQADAVVYDYALMNYVPAAISDETAPLFSLTEDVVQALTGQRPPRVVAGPANEGYLLIGQGIPTICGLGPSGRNAHAPNEYVEIDGLVEAASIFALVARRLSAP